LAKKSAKNEGGERTEVQGEGIQQMPDLWQVQSIYKEIWNLPDLFQKFCFTR
jgi:hypothetical protein